MVVQSRFLSKNQARLELITCDYLKVIATQEINLRRDKNNNASYSRVELLENYINSVLEFSIEEKTKTEYALKVAVKLLEKEFPNFVDQATTDNHINFIKVEGSLDWHFPFTINRCIVLPLRTLYNKSKEELVVTCVHELIHIHQRYQHEFYDEIYKNNFGFDKINHNKLIVLSDYERKIVTNPDGLFHEWVIRLYDGLYVPMMMYLKNRHYSVLLKLEYSPTTNNYITTGEPILAHSRQDYIMMVQGCNEQLDHPNEIISCIITKNIFKK